uniref:WGS project CBMG000000000 data, contig CS5907-c003188 n=1 Tax=Fusarium acuminatum CS5907 TaxID=1318461 RepID=A0A090M9Y9_9HYPO|nr:unnamed protein product [Fusarium acuminatum CS5907]
MHACGTTCAVPHETASCLEELKRTLLVRCELAAMTASSMRRPEFKKFKLSGDFGGFATVTSISSVPTSLNPVPRPT